MPTFTEQLNELYQDAMKQDVCNIKVSVDESTCDDSSNALSSDGESDGESDWSQYSSTDSDDSGSESSFVDDILNEMGGMMKATTVGTQNLFLSTEMIELLRESNSDSDLLGAEKASILHHMAPRRNSAGAAEGPGGTIVKPAENGIVYCHQTTNPLKGTTENSADYHPKDIIKSFLKGKKEGTFPVKVSTLDNFFTEEKSSGYSHALMTAVRQDDLGTIQKLHKSGHNLQCCNQWKESIVHAIARRGRLDILKYAVQEADVNLRVCCDTGRNPLHDACWTASPNFECIEFILEQCADLILIADNRGFTPLDYAPKDSHRRWCLFLEAHRDFFEQNLCKSIEAR